MVNITHITKKLLLEKPYLHEALNLGLVNIIALSEHFKPTIENELNKEVKSSAIGMAIRRFSNKNVKRLKFSSKTDMNIRSNLIEISIENNEKSNKRILELYNKINIKEGDVLNVIQGNFEILILTNGKYYDYIKKLFKGIKIKKNLASLTIKIPKESLNVPGFYYSITKALMMENIPIVDIVNTRNEASIILDEKDIPRAFEKLSKGISIEYFQS